MRNSKGCGFWGGLYLEKRLGMVPLVKELRERSVQVEADSSLVEVMVDSPLHAMLLVFTSILLGRA